MQDASPFKRAKTSASTRAVATAAATALTAEPALLENIISFIPSSNEALGMAKPSAVLQTIATLCRAIPGLSQLVGPPNESFWRNMVLTHFDFTVDENDAFNVEDHSGGDYCADDDDAVDDECDGEYAHWHRHPQHGPLEEWARAQQGKRVPESFLVDGLHYWPFLDTHFKPTAYGFLWDIQQDRSRMSALWPDHEDAFSLFFDLLLLPGFRCNDELEWETGSHARQTAFPCLLGRFPTKIVGRGFAMLKFCDFAPHFWVGTKEPVSERWSGFDEPRPEIECKFVEMKQRERAKYYADSDEDGDCHNDCEMRTGEESSLFPISAHDDRFHPFQHLRRFVHEAFSDWRRVHLSQCEETSPVFFIGQAKRSGRCRNLLWNT